MSLYISHICVLVLGDKILCFCFVYMTSFISCQYLTCFVHVHLPQSIFAFYRTESRRCQTDPRAAPQQDTREFISLPSVLLNKNALGHKCISLTCTATCRKYRINRHHVFPVCTLKSLRDHFFFFFRTLSLLSGFDTSPKCTVGRIGGGR